MVRLINEVNKDGKNIYSRGDNLCRDSALKNWAEKLELRMVETRQKAGKCSL